MAAILDGVRILEVAGFNEHGDEILAGLGLDWDAIIDLKVRGLVARVS